MRSGHECLHFGKLVPVAPFVRGAVGGPKNALCIADSGGVLDFFCLLWLLEKCFLMHLCLSRTPVLFVCRQCPLSLYWLGLLPQSLQLVTCIFCFPSFIHGTRYPFRVSFLSFQYLFSVLIVVVANVWWCLWNVLRFFLVHWFLTEIQLLRSMPTYLHVWFVCLTTYT